MPFDPMIHGGLFLAAFLAATATTTADAAPRITDWNPVVHRIEPNDELRPLYDTLFDRYARLYAGTKDVMHELAAEQRGAIRPTTSSTTSSTLASEAS